ncbi:MAG TPA: penicillin-binding transpeptidase domain-containing protein [Clostridia bacterium]|nr:penicillin-binding transpeptidase domain-containing protein [Clostridia bacterium]
MKTKRIISFFFLFLCIFVGIILRLFWLSQSDNEYKQAAASHGTYNLTLSSNRGTIYDTNLKPLVNNTDVYYAAVSPTTKNSSSQLEALRSHVLNFKTFLTRMEESLPFLTRVDSLNIQAKGVTMIKTTQRYSDSALAPHIIGYLGSDGNGVSGIEKSYNSQLAKYSQTISAKFAIDANGRSLEGVPADIEVDGDSTAGGVVLTIDRNIQQIAQKAADKYLKTGAIVVMDVKNGDILASVSNPGFSQNSLGAALTNQESPMLNRAFSAYNVGSIFKIAVAASALESGVSSGYSINCSGSVDIYGRTFNDEKKGGHGSQNMSQAMANSCNVYYISLGQKIGGNKILDMAKKLGFGTSGELAPGLKPDDGVLPTSSSLEIPAALANFSMGQGNFMATPVQVARMISAVANGGLLPTPRLVKELVDDKMSVVKDNPSAVPDRVMSAEIAKTLKNFLIGTVKSGTGVPAAPTYGGAGGKTATAETGWVKNGKAINQAWFAGFYPADNPKYAIVALLENGVAGGADAGPAFKYIADSLAPSLGYPTVSESK